MNDLFDIVMMNDLHFDQTRQKGVVFHMMSALPDEGRLGVTAVGDRHDEAQSRYETCLSTVHEDARAALRGE